MNRRFPVVLFAAMAALIALAWLLAWATHGGEPLFGSRAEPPREAGALRSGEVPSAAAPAPDAPQIPAPLAESPRALPAGTGRVRVVVDETATRLSAVDVRLQREGDEHPTPLVTVAAEHAWPDLAPGRWQVLLGGTGWAAEPDHVDLGPGGEARVQVRPRNRIEGLVVAGRSGRPVAHANLTVEAWMPMEPGGAPSFYNEVGHADLDLPDGRFALAGASLPVGGTDPLHFLVRADAAGLLQGVSDRLPLAPAPFWSGVIIVLPDPVLTGHVIGVDPHDGRVPVPAARVLLVDPSVSLSAAIVSGGLAQFLPSAPEPFDVAEADVQGAFAFGPLPGSATVLTARLLVRGNGWLPALSEPLEIDQRAPARDVELLLARGGRLHGLIAVALGPPVAGERAPVALPESVNVSAAGEGGAGAASRFVSVPRRVPSPAAQPDTALFEFDVDGLPAGRWQVLASLRPPDALPDSQLGVQTLVTVADVIAGRRTDVSLALEAQPAGVTVSGTARLPEGLALDEADAALWGAPANGQLPPPVATGPLRPDGSFELHGVPPGDWTLLLFATSPQHRDLLIAAGFVRVGADSPPPLHLDLARPEVRVQAGPATRARRLRLSGSCGDAVLDTLVALGRVSVQPDADGGARLCGLLPGRWTLRADGEPPASVDFDLPPGADVVRMDLP